MTAVTFAHGLFLHDADNLDDFVTVTARREPTQSREPRGSLQITASGRRRWRGRAGIEESFAVSTRTRDKTVAGWFDDREGETLLYRDKRGRVETVVLTSVDVADLNSNLYEITLTCRTVDPDEPI